MYHNEFALVRAIRTSPFGNKERSLPLRLITYAEHLSSFAILNYSNWYSVWRANISLSNFHWRHKDFQKTGFTIRWRLNILRHPMMCNHLPSFEGGEEDEEGVKIWGGKGEGVQRQSFASDGCRRFSLPTRYSLQTILLTVTVFLVPLRILLYWKSSDRDNRL